MFRGLMMDLVSVVIPAYNSAKWINTTLGSVLAQSHRELEIIVVDDGSSDGTAEVADHALSCFPGSYKILRQAHNGVSAARNKGWRAASGEWIQFLDSDDLLSTDKIKLQVAVARQSPPEIAVLYSSWQRVAGEEDQLSPIEEAQTPQVDGKPPASLLIGKNSIQLGSALIRRMWLETIHGFNEKTQVNEDMELVVRIAEAGGGFRFVPSSGPILLWRMILDRPRWGDETARYKMRDVAKTWLGLIRQTACYGHVENCGLSAEDSKALVADCSMLLRLLYRHDREAFHECLGWVRGLIPGYAPTQPRLLWLIAKCLGYENAEAVSEIVRTVKSRLRRV